MENNNNRLRQCAICGGDCALIYDKLYDDRFGTPGEYDIVKCRDCGLEQTWPQPSESELKSLYENFYNFGGEEGTCYARLREWFFHSFLYQLWLRWDGDISFHLPKGTGRLLDVGCNEGRGLTLYQRNGFKVEGLEINESAAEVARRKGFQVYALPLDRFCPEVPYEVVVLSNVLEHAPNPLKMLKQVHDLLASGGQVWISCPNGAGYWRRFFGRYWNHWHVPFHLWQFSPETLRGVLEQANFQVIKMATFTPALWLTHSLMAASRSKKGRANRWLRSAPMVAGLMLATRGALFFLDGNLNRQMAGDCLIVTAQRLS